jgi:Ulp1 family protease
LHLQQQQHAAQQQLQWQQQEAQLRQQQEALRLQQERQEAAAKHQKALQQQQQQQQEEALHLQQAEQEALQQSAQPRGPSLIDSSAERKTISHALSDGHDDDVIVQVGEPSGHKVRRGAMQSLKPGVWVKDEVINSFFHLLSQQDGELCKNNVTRKRNGFFNSFFMTKLLNEGNSNRSRIGEYEYNNIRNWSTNFVPGGDIFKVDKLFFPINVERTHWVLAVADILNEKIEMYDSGSRKYNYQSIGKNGIRCLETLLRYLEDKHKHKKKTPLPNTNRWQLIPCQSDTPQQQNSKLA